VLCEPDKRGKHAQYLKVQVISPPPKNERIMLRRRKKLGKEFRKKHKGKCFYCKRMVKVKHVQRNDPLRATLDHVVPRSHGGKDSRKNLVLACFQCNQAKGRIGAEEFMRLMGLVSVGQPSTEG
jgi:5-methylcytosine-specific restriction endonuclease McrA